jgi:RNA polymerase sigma factor (sigma-70 family)
MAIVHTVSPAELVARCRGGDEEAWAALVERFSRYVYAIAIQGFRLREHDAEDVFQEVFARVYERLDSLRSDDAIQPWIAQLTRRLCVDKLRASSREEPTDEPEDSPVPDEDALAKVDQALDVHDALVELSDNCRDILDRFFARDESYRTIAEALDLPAGTIASRISRCLVKLREQLEGRNVVVAHVLLAGDVMNAYDEDRLAELIAALPPAPEGWVRAAQELPLARKSLDEIVARAEADAAFRQALIANLESALAQAGYEPERPLVEELRRRYSAGS